MARKTTSSNKVKQNKDGSFTNYNKGSDGKWKKTWGGHPKKPKK